LEKITAMARVDIPEETRNDFYLYVDEFQNFATESFANILSEARKYHLNLILANQYVTQIDEKVRDAIFGNAGSIISFRVGAVDAEFLEKEFEPAFTANDVVNLPKWQIYLKLMIDGIAGDAFSATTLPPIKLEAAGNEEKIIRISRERYTTSKTEVEDKIRRWTGMLSETEREELRKSMTQQPVASQGGAVKKPKAVPKKAEMLRAEKTKTEKKKETKEAQPVSDSLPEVKREKHPQAEGVAEESVVTPAEKQEARSLFDAQCATCEKPIQVPFEPDVNRPTFCKECLKDYQRAVAKERQAIENTQDKQKDTDKNNKNHRSKPTSYKAGERPMSLGQMKHVAPKKFKSLRPKSGAHLSELRQMVRAIRPTETN
jgi:CxxC-x17-CxxC domain-containing protein